MNRIHQMSGRFHNLKIQHNYRDFNNEADQLLKKYFLMEEGILFSAKGMGDQVGSFEEMTEY
jgi:hypothetical protein